MAALLTVAQVRDHIETGLVDDVLTLEIAAADAEIIRRLGPLASQVEVLSGGALFLMLTRAASSISSAVERIYNEITGTTNVTLVAADYSLMSDGYRVERLTSGTYPSSTWRGLVTMTSVPKDTTDERKMLLVRLVKLSLNYSGHMVVAAGDVHITSLETYADARAALFRDLATGGRRLIF